MDIMKNDWNCIFISLFLSCITFAQVWTSPKTLVHAHFYLQVWINEKKKHWKTTFRLIYFPFVASFFLHRAFYYIAKSLLRFRFLSGNCNKIDNFVLYMRSVLTTVINNRFDSIKVSTILDRWWWLFFTSSVSWLCIYQSSFIRIFNYSFRPQT